jgi:DHA1 family bicyclomycin/chloramphenicol resistance-like MFS transporter
LLEDVYHTSPQVFSYIFALLSVILVGSAQVGGRLVARIPPRRLFRVGLHAIALGSLGTLVTVIVGGGLTALVICLTPVFGGNGLTFPNGTAVAMADRGEVAGSVSALLGVGQFGLAAIVAPLVGLGGSRAALPAAIVMCACGVGGWLLYRFGAPRRQLARR